eukprot:scaffold386618_cov25-Prasinocladus_malaysianus.AAC.1
MSLEIIAGKQLFLEPVHETGILRRITDERRSPAGSARRAYHFTNAVTPRQIFIEAGGKATLSDTMLISARCTLWR